MAAVRLDVLANTTHLRRELRRARRSLRQFKQDAADAGGGLAGFRAGVGGLISGFGGLGVVALAGAAQVASIGTAAFAAASQYDDARNSIIRATGATGTELERLVDTTTEVFSRLPVSFGEAAAGVGVIATAFGDEVSPAIEEATVAVAQYAEITGRSVEEVGTEVGRVVNLFDRQSGEVEQFLDAATAASQRYNIASKFLLEQLREFGPQFDAMGISIEEATFLLGNLVKEGIRLEPLKSVFEEVTTAAIALGRHPADVLEELIDQAQSASTNVQALDRIMQTLGGTNAQLFVTAFRSVNVTLSETNEIVSQSTGLLAQTAEATRSWTDSWRRLGNALIADVAPKLTSVLGLIGQIASGQAFGIGGSLIGGDDDGDERTIDDIRADLAAARRDAAAEANAPPSVVEQIGNYFAEVIGQTAGGGSYVPDTSAAADEVRRLEEELDAALRRRDIALVDTALRTRYNPAVTGARRTRFDAELSDLVAIDDPVDRYLQLTSFIGRATSAGFGDIATEARRQLDRTGGVIGANERDATVERLERNIEAGINPDENAAALAEIFAAELADTLPGSTERAEATIRLNNLNDETAARNEANMGVRSLGSSAGGASTALRALSNEIQRLADGIIVLNDGVQAYVPDTILDQRTVGNSVITSLGRSATASTDTPGAGTTEGEHRTGASVPPPTPTPRRSNWPREVF